VSAKSELPRPSATASRAGGADALRDDGRIEIDNNAAERALRGVAWGAGNYLFMGSDAGGERAAAIYSLVETAKLNGLDPRPTCARCSTRIAEHPINRIDELLPWNIAHGRASNEQLPARWLPEDGAAGGSRITRARREPRKPSTRE
jgi:transposase